MMLVLPVQSFASAAMLGCAFAHQGMSSGLAMAEPVSIEAMPACHTPEQPEPQPAQHDCKHCAVCYMASALPIPSAITLPATPVRPGLFVSPPATSFVGFIPDSPERPPRASSL